MDPGMTDEGLRAHHYTSITIPESQRPRITDLRSYKPRIPRFRNSWLLIFYGNGLRVPSLGRYVSSKVPLSESQFRTFIAQDE